MNNKGLERRYFSNIFWLWEKNVRTLDKSFCAGSSKLHWRVWKKCLRKEKFQLEIFRIFSRFFKDQFSSFRLKTLAGFLKLKSTGPAEDLSETIIRKNCILIFFLGYPLSGSGVPVKKTVVAGGGLPELNYTCPQIYFEEYLFKKHVFYFFSDFDKKILGTWQKICGTVAIFVFMQPVEPSQRKQIFSKKFLSLLYFEL